MPTPSPQRASHWSVTINNPIKADEENIALARQKGWKVEGQLERGKEGTPHYQLAVRTPQVRFSAVKKAFPRAHIEVARNSAALAAYVVKEDTREGALTTEQSLYPSQQTVWEWFGSLSLTEEMLSEEYRVYLRQCADREVTPIRSYEWKQEYMLEQFDRVMADKIAEGYYCELIAVNPQIRSAIKKFGVAICKRHHRQKTDRQTEENLVLSQGITNANGDTSTQVALRVLEGINHEQGSEAAPRRQVACASYSDSSDDDRSSSDESCS